MVPQDLVLRTVMAFNWIAAAIAVALGLVTAMPAHAAVEKAASAHPVSIF